MIKIPMFCINSYSADKIYVYHNENVYRLTHERLSHIVLSLLVAVAKNGGCDYVTTTVLGANFDAFKGNCCSTCITQFIDFFTKYSLL